MMAERERPNPSRKRKKKLVSVNFKELKRKTKKKKNLSNNSEDTKQDEYGGKSLKISYDNDSMFSYWMRRNLGVRSGPLNTKSQYLPISCISKYGSSLSNTSYVFEGDGAIFNLEFSPDNKYLVAACENKDIAVFDPCIHKKVMSVSNAHNDSVNCVTFLDTRVFATCSDDTTIALWDARNLKTKVCSLTGHTNWVKSMNYNAESNILISSAFDNTVRTWKVNEFHGDSSVKSEQFIHIPFLTRTGLSCDFKKFIVATTTGLLLVIHNVDFSKLNSPSLASNKDFCHSVSDLLGNKKDPGIEPKVDDRKANRIEYLKNFPLNSKPWCIASLQIHPYGWNVLSRYTCNDESEWSVVHNIQDNGNGIRCEKNLSRLQGYVEEPNLAGGYIKEICYNHDGTIICSPFGNGVRLLGFNSNCDSFLDCLSDRPSELKELKFILSHDAPVLTTRFAKHIPILASGCLGGQVSFYQPRL